MARPPSMIASEDPAVAVPIALASFGAFQRLATVLDRRRHRRAQHENFKPLTHRHASVVYHLRSGILIQVNRIPIRGSMSNVHIRRYGIALLVNRLHNELRGFLRHPSVHEASEVEGWITVEIHLIVDKMIGAPAWNSNCRQLILWHELSVFIATPALMHSTPRVDQMLLVRVLLALLDDRVRVNYKT